MGISDMLCAEITDYLLRYMADNNLDCGDRLPSENTLCARFHTNRNTVRNALIILKSRGLISSSQGKGFFVAKRPDHFVYRLNQSLGLAESATYAHADHKALLTGVQHRPCTPEEASLLRLSEGSPVVALQQLRILNGQKSAFCTSVIPEKYIPGFKAPEGEFKGTNHILIEEYGLPHPLCSQVTISARMPEQNELMLLDMQPSIPILQQEILYTIHGEPVEYFVIRARGDCFQLSVRLDESNIREEST